MLMTALIIDIVLLVVLLIFTVHGASRGLLLSLCGLVAVLVAFIGAGFAAEALAPKVADFLEPRFAAAIEERLDQEIADSTLLPDPGDEVQTDDIPLTEILNILKDMGFQAALTCEEKLNYITGDPEQLYHLRRFNRPHGKSLQSILQAQKQK